MSGALCQTNFNGYNQYQYSSNQSSYGSNQQTGYGSPQQTGYGSNQQTGYGSNQQTGYGSTQQTGYGSNQQTDFGGNQQQSWSQNNTTKSNVRQSGGLWSSASQQIDWDSEVDKVFMDEIQGFVTNLKQ